MKIIDARVRVPYKSFANAAIFKDPAAMDAWASMFNMARPPKVAGMDELFADMERAGVSKALVSCRRGHNVENADIAEACSLYSDKLLGFVEIDPKDGVGLGLEEIDKYVLNGPCSGVAVEPGFNRRGPLFADDEQFYFVYEACEKNNIPLYFNFGGFIGPDYRYTDPDMIVKIGQTFPKLKMMIAHAAYPHVLKIIHTAVANPNVYVLPDMYGFDIPGGDIYIKAANTMLRNQIIFGSAYPIFDIKAAADYYMNCGIKEDILPNIMAGNVERFLGL
jgi:predicted TIM-barrel fold metal-dependent hydrolase